MKTVKHWVCPVDKKRKSALLLELISSNRWKQALVFSRTKHGANRLTRYLEEFGVKASVIHGNKSQGARTRALAEFKSGEVEILVATDIAARGLDIDALPQVVNFDLPSVPEDYIHRIGRTGRAGATGEAISLVSADEAKQLFDIERLLKQLLPRKLIDGFEPTHDLPESRADLLSQKPKRPKKPKKPKPGHQDGQRPKSHSKGSGRNRKPQNGRNSSQKRPSRNAGKPNSRARGRAQVLEKYPYSNFRTKGYCLCASVCFSC